jgi:hypothetical protein
MAIDEFQQIANFKDSKEFQKKLRGVWQHQHIVSYCLYGSRKHLLNELFEKQNYPSYKFGDIIHLDKISENEWIDYIMNRFQVTEKYISKEQASGICKWVESHSSYVQQLSWLVWLRVNKQTTSDDLLMGLNDLIEQNSLLYQREVEYLSAYQMNFLKAISNGVTKEFNRKSILETYNLGTSANITRLKKSLIDRELIDYNKDGFYFTDPVFKLWFKKEILRKPII